MPRTPAAIWVTKYALTRGVIHLRPGDNLAIDYEWSTGRTPQIRYAVVTVGHGLSARYFTYRFGKEAFTRKTDALVDAEKRRAQKARKLRAETTKLAALVFEEYGGEERLP